MPPPRKTASNMANHRPIFELLEANDRTIPEWGKADWEVRESAPEPITAPADVTRQPTCATESSDQGLRREALAVICSTHDPDEFRAALEMLERVGTKADVDLLKIAARHDAFTWRAGRAVCRILDDPTNTLWEMARGLEGAGKVELVELLCPFADDRPDVQDWLLRQGCISTFMTDEIGHMCAVAGRLAEALAADEIDDHLLDGTGEIIWTLAMGGVLGGCMEDLPEGLPAIRHYLRHVRCRANSIRRLRVVLSIHSWLEWPKKMEHARYVSAMLLASDPDKEEEEDDEFAPMSWPEREKHGWTPEVRAEIAEACLQILRQPRSKELVVDAYRDDSRSRHWAWSIARLVGLDLWEDGFRLLEAEPASFPLYTDLLKTDDTARVTRLITFAEERLPLDALASGPSQRPCFSLFHAEGCLNHAVAAMAMIGMFRPKLVAALLRSPDRRARAFAIKVLGRFPGAVWRGDLLPVLEKCERDEPEPEVRDRIRRLIEECGTA